MSAEPDLVVRVPVTAEAGLDPVAAAELASLRLWDLGATAVGEQSGPDGTLSLVASFPTPQAARTVAASLGVAAEEVAPDWRDAWREYAEAVEVAGGLLVAPSWRPVALAGDRLVLEIDPGPCFGSGTHASTRLLLQLLAAHPPLGATVLDVGTGSGILAVAAARLGAERVVAVDVDPAAVTVAAANADRNGVGGVVAASVTPIGALEVTADLAVVNVTAGVHAEVGPATVERVRPGGELLLAGLLPGQWRHVAGAYGGCDVIERPELDGWVGARLRRL